MTDLTAAVCPGGATMLSGSRAAAARIAFALTPSSASCERVFSLMAWMFSSDQYSTLGDQMEAGMMLRYNKRKVG